MHTDKKMPTEGGNHSAGNTDRRILHTIVRRINIAARYLGGLLIAAFGWMR